MTFTLDIISQVLKARISAEREKLKDKTLGQVAESNNVGQIDQLNIKIRRSLKGHNAKVWSMDLFRPILSSMSFQLRRFINLY